MTVAADSGLRAISSRTQAATCLCRRSTASSGDAAAAFDVLVGEAVQHLAEHGPGVAAHLDGDRRHPHLRLRGDADHSLGDPLGKVGDALELAVDPQHREDEAKVARHRLGEREQAHALLLDLHLHAVDLGIAVADPLGLGGIALDDRADDPLDPLLDEGPHGEEIPPHAEQFGMEVDGHGSS